MSMKTFKVEIQSDGVTAKTLNPVPMPPMNVDAFNVNWQIEWQQAESERKVYDIENQDGINHLDEKGNIIETEFKYKPGSIHEATEINTKQIRIL